MHKRADDVISTWYRNEIDPAVLWGAARFPVFGQIHRYRLQSVHRCSSFRRSRKLALRAQHIQIHTIAGVLAYPQYRVPSDVGQGLVLCS